MTELNWKVQFSSKVLFLDELWTELSSLFGQMNLNWTLVHFLSELEQKWTEFLVLFLAIKTKVSKHILEPKDADKTIFLKFITFFPKKLIVYKKALWKQLLSVLSTRIWQTPLKMVFKWTEKWTAVLFSVNWTEFLFLKQ